jgi:hypothetical protein
MLADLMKKIDVFLERYSRDDASRKAMRNDLLDLIQVAVEHGEAKDQNKITGIIVKGIKAFMGGKE